MPLLCLFLYFLAQIQVMEYKFLPMIAIMVPMFPVPNEAPPRWVKLNKSPAWVGANTDYFGRFSYPKNIFVSSFMLVHRSGTVTCDKKDYSYWGCAPDVNLFSVPLTYQNNKILAPEATPPVGKGGWYPSGRIRSRLQFFVLGPCVLSQKEASMCLCQPWAAPVVWWRFARPW